MVKESLKYGCNNVLLYLMNLYPKTGYLLRDYYVITCCYGYKGVAALLRTFRVSDRDLSVGNDVLAYLKGEDILDELKHVLNIDEISCMIINGYVSQACALLEDSNSRMINYLNKAVFHGIMSQHITDISQLQDLIAFNYICLCDIISKLVAYPLCDVSIIMQLCTLLSDDELQQVAKVALQNGNWEFSSVILS